LNQAKAQIAVTRKNNDTGCPTAAAPQEKMILSVWRWSESNRLCPPYLARVVKEGLTPECDRILIDP